MTEREAFIAELMSEASGLLASAADRASAVRTDTFARERTPEDPEAHVRAALDLITAANRIAALR